MCQAQFCDDLMTWLSLPALSMSLFCTLPAAGHGALVTLMTKLYSVWWRWRDLPDGTEFLLSSERNPYVFSEIGHPIYLWFWRKKPHNISICKAMKSGNTLFVCERILNFRRTWITAMWDPEQRTHLSRVHLLIPANWEKARRLFSFLCTISKQSLLEISIKYTRNLYTL